MHIKLNWLDKSLAELNLIWLGNLCVYMGTAQYVWVKKCLVI